MSSGRFRGLVFLLIFDLVLVAAFVWLAGEVVSGRSMRFDLNVRDTIHRHATPLLTIAMLVATFVGRAYVVLPLTIVLCAALWRKGFKHQARWLGIAMAGEIPIEHGLKWAFHRPRPQPFFDLTLPSTYSFPSGHALAAVIFYSTLAALLMPSIRKSWRKLLVWIAAALIIGIIGFSRVYLGVHYPTDVLAGYISGLIWVLALLTIR